MGESMYFQGAGALPGGKIGQFGQERRRARKLPVKRFGAERALIGRNEKGRTGRPCLSHWMDFRGWLSFKEPGPEPQNAEDTRNDQQ